MEVILENIRSFAGRHVIIIKPLTILVGENSTGKSTFLAALSTLSDPKGYPQHPKAPGQGQLLLRRAKQAGQTRSELILS